MIVREATREDVAAIVEFQRAMARETEGRDLDAALVTRGVAAVFDAADGRERGWYLVAEADGDVIGSLMVTYEWSDWRAGWFWWIQSVFIVEARRGRGVYRALYAEVLRRAEARGDVCGVRLYVELENTRARAVYERLGMVRAHYHLYEVDFVLGAGAAAPGAEDGTRR
ncbi:MAG: GNAT family N-acetyltransferase [Planctomycetota bacterium]